MTWQFESKFIIVIVAVTQPTSQMAQRELNRQSDRKIGGRDEKGRERKSERKEYCLCLGRRCTLMGDARDWHICFHISAHFFTLIFTVAKQTHTHTHPKLNLTQ